MTGRLSFRAVTRTDRGAVRQTNQDALFVSTERPLWAVADGMGGHEGGEIASACVVEALDNADFSCLSLEDAARNAIAKANSVLVARNSRRSPPGNMGTTVALLGIDGARSFCLWAGDSRICLLRQGTFQQLTRDHTYIEELLESGALTRSEAERHPHRHMITRAIGIAEHAGLESCRGDLRSEDTFILMTDGVSGVCREHEIANAMAATDLNSVADELAARCIKAGAPDNFSFILVRAAQTDTSYS
ncbi:MAG: PP2C family protein-serine/threonine phosphatase [Alphaproteobacteria bacterium]